MNITHNGYTLKNIETHHIPFLCDWWNNGSIMQYFGYPSGLGVTVEDVYVLLSKDESRRCHRLIIENNGEPIGEAYYQELDNVTAKIGIRICKAASHNKGMGKVILSMLISALFERLDYKIITVMTLVDNSRAQHVYEKLGFRRCGTKTNTLKIGQEISLSFILYEMTKNDFVSYL